MRTALYYVADPMCSWCWGFRPELEGVRRGLAEGTGLRTVLGGLAPDSDEPMDEATRRYVQEAWDAVEARTGARFERAFWTRCEPRRSTWPACRAVLAAGAQDGEGEEGWVIGARAGEMFEAIQRAYYLQARNPSDRSVLVELAQECEGIDAVRFERDLAGAEIERRLQRGFDLRRELGVHTFPSLVLVTDGVPLPILSGYGNADDALAALARAGT